MSQYQPPTDQQLPPGATRPRATSSASIKYHPDNQRSLQPTAPQASAHVPIPSYIQQGGPAFAGQPIYGTPPVANSAYFGTPTGQQIGPTPPVGNAGFYGSSPGYFGTSPGRVYAQTQLHPGYPVPQNSGPPTSSSQPFTPAAVPNPNYNGPPTVDPDGFMRPPRDPRRASASSTRSHRSERSGRSHHSHGRRDSHHHTQRRHSERRSSEDSYDEDKLTRDERRERNRRYSEGAELKPVKRVKSHRPTIGDSLYSFFGVIKDALGPRDKY